MRMYDLIMKKRNGEALTKEEIQYMITEYVDGRIPDYQMSAFLMAGYFQGMTEEETLAMTLAVAHSGDMVDLSGIEGMKVDKHSTGGVGDKTTLIIAPIVASCGVKVAKMSGRGLGHTGGTVDKMESIPGMQTSLDRDRFFEVVNKTGLSVIGQSGNLAPADKKLYALRDVTATVDSIPLIAVSIMSKKLAAGNDGILLDVKTGSGAFMKTVEDSIALAKEMVSIGENAGKKMTALITNMDIPLGHNIGNSLEVIEAVQTLKGQLAKEMVSIGENAGKKMTALITNMDIPLGHNIGNSLEVIEAVQTLKGHGPKDLTEVCLQLASNMLYLSAKGTIEECRQMSEEAISSGRALDRLIAMVEAQGGDADVIRDTDKFAKASYQREVLADKDGYITHMNAEGLISGKYWQIKTDILRI